jgi:methionyl aminopeptidase
VLLAAEKERLNFHPPAFEYSGDLRPAYVTPRRPIPAHIEKPDYASNGQAQGENAHSIYIHNAKEIAGIKAACKLGRQALDLAANTVRPGVTTDEIDRVVHEFCVSQDCYPSPLNYRFFPKACCTSVAPSASVPHDAQLPSSSPLFVSCDDRFFAAPGG